MSEPTTNDSVSSEADLAKLEEAANQAGEAETKDAESAASEESPKESSYGKAFEELAEKKGFSSPDELARHYKELESYKTKLEQTNKSLQQSAVKPQEAPSDDLDENLPPEQKKALQMLRKVVSGVVDEKIAPIRNTFEEQKARSEIESVREKYPNFKGEMVERVMDYVQDHKNVSLEDAYRVVSYDYDLSSAQSQSGKAVKAQGKTRAYTESAGQAKTGSDLDYSKMSLDELEQILPKAGQYVDHRGRLRR